MFIYVFSEQDRNKLLEEGYELLKDDDVGNTYVFVRYNSKFDEEPEKEKALFSSLGLCFETDVLSF